MDLWDFKIHCFCLRVRVVVHVCLVVIQKATMIFQTDMIKSSPFYPVAYSFLRGKKPSTRIYSYIYGKSTRTRTRKRCMLRSLWFREGLRISSIVETLWDLFWAGIVLVSE